MFSRGLKIIATFLTAFFLFGSGPMRDGADLSGGGGYRAHERERKYGPSCEMEEPTARWDYDDRIVDLAADFRFKTPDGGFVVAVEGAGAVKHTVSGTCTDACDLFPDDVGSYGFGLHLAARFGFQWEYFGVLGGLGTYAGTLLPIWGPSIHGVDETPDWALGFFPSMEFWIGNRTLHFFSDGLANMAYHNLTFSKVGFGHASEKIKAAGGLGLGYKGFVGFADLDRRFLDRWWIGAAGDFQSTTNFAAMLRITYEFETQAVPEPAQTPIEPVPAR